MYGISVMIKEMIRAGGNRKMKKLTIKLNTVDDVKNFVNTVSKYDFDVDLIAGRYAVNAKSIMGIFSLDLSEKLELQAHTDDENSPFFSEIQSFIIK